MIKIRTWILDFCSQKVSEINKSFLDQIKTRMSAITVDVCIW